MAEAPAASSFAAAAVLLQQQSCTQQLLQLLLQQLLLPSGVPWEEERIREYEGIAGVFIEAVAEASAVP